MSSSISSSNRFALGASAVICAFVALEMAFRIIEPWLSNDVRHLRKIPAIVAKLAASPAPRVMVVGNSLTREGIDETELAQALRESGVGQVSLARVYPDDTAIAEWYYLLRGLCKKGQALPDVVVIPFIKGQLLDGRLEFEELQRIALFSPLRDITAVIRFEKMSFGQSIELLAAKCCRFFANRQRVQIRVLDLLPHYRVTARWLNAAVKEQAQGRPASMRHLSALLDWAAAARVKLIFVAMPLPQPYSAPASMLSLLRASNARFIDASQIAGIDASAYNDGFHLNAAGARILSRWLGRELAEELRPFAPYERRGALGETGKKCVAMPCRCMFGPALRGCMRQIALDPASNPAHILASPRSSML